MPGSFEDYSTADRTVKIIRRIVKRVLREERPEPKLGKVYSYNPGAGTAQILFAGETVDNLVRVKVPGNLRPGVVMATTFDELGYDAPSDIVRVWGKPGNYFILGYYAGQPSVTREGVETTEFNFPVAATVWPLQHNLGQLIVNIQAYKSEGGEIIGDPVFVTENLAEIHWYYPQAGSAIVQT